jgi:ammonium transporter, Amt family
LAYSLILTLVIGTVIQKTMGFRITEEEEVTGIDTVVHAESGYDFASLGSSSGSTAPLAGQARATAQDMARSTEGVGA